VVTSLALVLSELFTRYTLAQWQFILVMSSKISSLCEVHLLVTHAPWTMHGDTH